MYFSRNDEKENIVNIKLSINKLKEKLVVNEILDDLNNINPNEESNTQLFELKNNLFSDAPWWLAKADFSRSHKDLIAEYNGTKALFKNFFSTHEPPNIQTSNGLHFKGSLINYLSKNSTDGMYVQESGESNTMSIGEVTTIKGTVNASRVDGNIFELSSGDPIFQGDVIQVKGDGSVGLTFVDKTTLSLSDGGKMVLDELVFDPNTGSGSMAVDMLEGAFSFVSGEIAKSGDDAMSVSTPVATIGIRGTSVAGKAAVEGNENSFTLLEDSDGSVGQISVTNSGGSQILSQVGATTSISSFNIPPPPPIILSAAQIQANYGTALDVLPPTPINAPQPQAPPPPQGDSSSGEDSSEAENQDEDDEGEDGTEESTDDTDGIDEEDGSESVVEEEVLEEEVISQEDTLGDDLDSSAEESSTEFNEANEIGTDESEDTNATNNISEDLPNDDPISNDIAPLAAESLSNTELSSGQSGIGEFGTIVNPDAQPGEEPLSPVLPGSPFGDSTDSPTALLGGIKDAFGVTSSNNTFATGQGIGVFSLSESLGSPYAVADSVFGEEFVSSMGGGLQLGPDLGFSSYGLIMMEPISYFEMESIDYGTELSAENVYFEDQSLYQTEEEIEETTTENSYSSESSESSETSTLGQTFEGTSANDYLVGTAYADTLKGGQGNDTISGLGGDDIIKGGIGNDIMKGGQGDDQFHYDAVSHFGDIITDFGTGNDKIVLGYNPTHPIYSRSGFYTHVADGGDVYDIDLNGGVIPNILNYKRNFDNIPIGDFSSTVEVSKAFYGYVHGSSYAQTGVINDYLVVTGDGNDTAVFYWEDLDSDGMFFEEDNELTRIAILDNFDNDVMTGDEFTIQSTSTS